MQVTFNLGEFSRKAAQLGATEKQIPYALATGMTWTMREAVKDETAAIPISLDRPVPFTQRAVGYTPATKTTLRFEVFIKDIQAKYLTYAVDGGTRSPAQAKTLAVPFVQRNAFGNVSRGTLKAISRNQNVFSGTPKGGNRKAGLWRRGGGAKKAGRSTRLTMLALYSPTFSYSKRLDFSGIFERAVRANMATKVGEAVQRVIARFAARE